MGSDKANPVLPISLKHLKTLIELLMKKDVDVVYLDYKKAFDSILHQRLLCRLQGYGITGKLLNWIREFLCDRLQRVVVDGCTSNWCCVKSGVPQGSLLGPLLFLNDVSDIISCS